MKPDPLGNGEARDRRRRILYDTGTKFPMTAFEMGAKASDCRWLNSKGFLSKNSLGKYVLTVEGHRVAMQKPYPHRP